MLHSSRYLYTHPHLLVNDTLKANLRIICDMV